MLKGDLFCILSQSAFVGGCRCIHSHTYMYICMYIPRDTGTVHVHTSAYVKGHIHFHAQTNRPRVPTANLVKSC